MRQLFQLPLAASALYMIVVFTLTGCSKEDIEFKERLRPVKFVSVGIVDRSLENQVFPGTVQAAQEARLSFNVGGTVTDIAIVIGDTIGPGDLVARLDPTTYRVEVERDRASLAIAEAEQRSAESDYQRVRQLYANDNASQTDLESALAKAESAIASSEAARQSMRLSRINLGYTSLESDDRCTVGAVFVEEQENVAAGSTVATVNCGDRWEVNIDVPESLISAFQLDQSGAVEIDSIPARRFGGRVSEIGTSGTGSTFPVTLQLEESHVSMRSGLAAEVSFSLYIGDEAQGNFVLPAAAVGQDAQGLHVYTIVRSDSSDVARLERREVVVGGLAEGGIEVVSGLEEGELVLAAGHSFARDGLQVTLSRTDR